MTSRERLLLAIVLVALGVTALWSASALATARTNAREARSRAAEAEALASQILALRTQPASAATADFPPGEITRRVTQAAEFASIDGAANGTLESINPELPRRIGETPYRETPTSVRLRKITLGQLLRFLHATESDGSLRVTSLRLTAPRNVGSGLAGAASAAEDRTHPYWSAELTLSHLTYSPR